MGMSVRFAPANQLRESGRCVIGTPIRPNGWSEMRPIERAQRTLGSAADRVVGGEPAGNGPRAHVGENGASRDASMSHTP